MDIDRRRLLLAATAAGIVAPSAGAVAPAGAGPGPRADFGIPAANLRALLKILASTDPDDVVVSWGTGRVFACIAGQAPVPLFGTHSVVAARSRLRPDGSFVLRQHIVGFRTTFGTETVIDQMTNPLTGERIDLPLTDYGISDVDHRLDGTYLLRKDLAPARLPRPVVRSWSIDAGTLALSDDAAPEGPGLGQPKIDAVTRFASVADLLDGKNVSPRSWFSFSAVDPFRSYLKMREPGFQLWHVHGRKVSADEPLPAFAAELVRSRFPKLMELAAP